MNKNTDRAKTEHDELMECVKVISKKLELYGEVDTTNLSGEETIAFIKITTVLFAMHSFYLNRFEYKKDIDFINDIEKHLGTPEFTMKKERGEE